MAKIRTTEGGFVDMKVNDLRGRRVRLRVDLQNGRIKVPAGTIVKVSGVWRSGVNVEAPACATCGVSVFISQVHRNDIEILNQNVPRALEEP